MVAPGPGTVYVCPFFVAVNFEMKSSLEPRPRTSFPRLVLQLASKTKDAVPVMTSAPPSTLTTKCVEP